MIIAKHFFNKFFLVASSRTSFCLLLPFDNLMFAHDPLCRYTSTSPLTAQYSMNMPLLPVNATLSHHASPLQHPRSLILILLKAYPLQYSTGLQARSSLPAKMCRWTYQEYDCGHRVLIKYEVCPLYAAGLHSRGAESETLSSTGPSAYNCKKCFEVYPMSKRNEKTSVKSWHCLYHVRHL